MDIREIKHHVILAREVLPSDVLHFGGTLYKVKSVIVKYDRVDIAYWDTNDEQPYTYDPEALLDLFRYASSDPASKGGKIDLSL